MKTRVLVIAVALLIVCVLTTTFYDDHQNRKEEGQGFQLVPPVFAEADNNTTFLNDTAGISIYVNLRQPIDLSLAKSAYRTIEKETADYVIGSLNLSDLSENDDVHCFVHANGWIVVYYLRIDPASKIVNWNYWSRDLTKSKLQMGLEKIGNVIQVYTTGAKYYHFQHPEANKFTIIVETHKDAGEDNFTVFVPSQITVYERSWCHYANVHSYSVGTSTFKIDGNEISKITKGSTEYTITNYGQLAWNVLDPDQFHTASITGGTSGEYGICVVLVYHEP